MEKSLTLAVNKGKREARKEKVVDGEIGKAGAFLVFGTWNKTNERRERKGEVSNFPFMLGLISIPNAPRLEDRGSRETHFRAKAFSVDRLDSPGSHGTTRNRTLFSFSSQDFHACELLRGRQRILNDRKPSAINHHRMPVKTLEAERKKIAMPSLLRFL